jgi:hypothetical protein
LAARGERPVLVGEPVQERGGAAQFELGVVEATLGERRVVALSSGAAQDDPMRERAQRRLAVVGGEEVLDPGLQARERWISWRQRASGDE